jgi:demethylmenaquinone methyltransferase/2-methoxy-6-polyprenyl-1,4-benzoquinol methylase
VDRLSEQREYYRQRAPEYDEWWQARGQYAKSPSEEARWFADVAEVTSALDAFRPGGDVLELAAGTGWWTARLARHARSVTAVDAAPEALALNQARSEKSGKIGFVEADIFDWEPPTSGFDLVFFAYWLSHVPADRLEAFQRKVRRALRPGGRIFLIDSYHPERLPDDRQQRILNNGRRFEVVKRYWQPSELEAIPGWNLTAHLTANRHIIYANS